jgi:hypothetical protein
MELPFQSHKIRLYHGSCGPFTSTSLTRFDPTLAMLPSYNYQPRPRGTQSFPTEITTEYKFIATLHHSVWESSRSQWPAARSKAWTVFAHSNIGIMGSNPTQSMDVCLRLFFVCVDLCVGSGLATGWSPVQGTLPTVYRIKKLKKRPRPNKGL